MLIGHFVGVVRGFRGPTLGQAIGIPTIETTPPVSVKARPLIGPEADLAGSEVWVNCLGSQPFGGATEPLRPDDPHPRSHPDPIWTPFLTRFRPEVDLVVTSWGDLGSKLGQIQVEIGSERGSKSGRGEFGVGVIGPQWLCSSSKSCEPRTLHVTSKLNLKQCLTGCPRQGCNS